jgi:PTS system beta-glucosides-specific IIC component
MAVLLSFFQFLPIFLGYTAMKKFGGTPFVGMAIAAAMVHPSLSGIMAEEPLYTLFEGTAFAAPVYMNFLGIPVILLSYTSSVIPIIFTTYLASKVEKFLAPRVSDLVKSFAVPALTVLAGTILGFLIVGPVATFLSDLLGVIFIWLFGLNATVAGFLYGAFIQVLVMFGVHWGFVAISLNNIATLGYDPITIAGLASAFGQAGVVLMIMLRTKSSRLKKVYGPAIVSALFGITEPSIYGVTLQFRRPFILACIASGIGGAIIGAGGVKQYFYGTNGIFGWLQCINPATGFDSSTLASILACIAAFVSAIVLMLLFDRDDTEVIGA